MHRENAVAIYWDFENIHASVFEATHGSSYSENRYQPQPPVVNISAVMDYAATVGVVAINRAYANWQWLSRYRDDLAAHGLDLIQHFPRGHKNGADIRLALDVLEDLMRFTHITHVIVVGSDSDYIGLAQRVKQLGRAIIGIGVKENASPHWIQCCTEFKFYQTLVGEPAAEPDHEVAHATLGNARELLLKALRQLTAQRGEPAVPRSALKVLMLRLDPSFDEANWGFQSFGAFVEAFSDAVQTIPSDSGGLVRLIEAPVAVPSMEEHGTDRAERRALDTYMAVLSKGGIRLLPAPWWRRAITLLERVFEEAPGRRLPSFEEMKQRLAERLVSEGMEGSLETVSKLRINLYQLRLFMLREGNVGLACWNGESLLDRVDRALVARLARFVAPPLDPEAVALLLYGESSELHVQRATRLIERAAIGNGAAAEMHG